MAGFYKNRQVLFLSVFFIFLSTACAKDGRSLLTRQLDPYAVSALPGLEVPPDFIFESVGTGASVLDDADGEGVRASNLTRGNNQSVEQEDRVFLLKLGAEKRNRNIRKVLELENVQNIDEDLLKEIERQNSTPSAFLTRPVVFS